MYRDLLKNVSVIDMTHTYIYAISAKIPGKSGSLYGLEGGHPVSNRYIGCIVPK